MEAYEKFIMDLHEICAECDDEFWAGMHNSRENGWVCDKCLIIDKLGVKDE